MILAKVVGTVVCSTNTCAIDGAKFLLVEKTNQHAQGKGDYVVALDLVGAGPNEMVYISESSSARETVLTFNKPVDAVIVGIIDMIDENETITYRK